MQVETITLKLNDVMKKLLTTFILLSCGICSSQNQPNCTPSGMNSIYVLTSTNIIYRIDNVNTTPSLPVRIDSIPSAAMGLTISNNLDGGTYSPTFYSILLNYYSYWNGSTWINTGHLSSTGNGNLGGGIKHIYNHRGTSGSIYSYNGTGDDANIVLFTSASSVWDIASDSLDNFYVLVTDASLMYKFDSLGTPLGTFQVTGIPTNLVQPGIALLGNTFYVLLGVPVNNALMRGTIIGNTISFSQIGIINLGGVQIQDIAACPHKFIPSNIDEIKNENKIFISPNPVTDILKIHKTKDNGKQSLQICNYTGQVVHDDPDFTEDFFDTRQLVNGIYFIKYSNEKYSSTTKFVVHH